MRTSPPRGLTRCEVCGEYHGHARIDGARAEIACRCAGIPCPICKTQPIHRPISNRYDEATATIVHVPWLMGIAGCSDCRQARRASQGTRRSGGA